MTKNYLSIILAATCFLFSTSKAQEGKPFEERYLEQVKETIAAQAKVKAALIRKKYRGDASMEKSLYTLFLEHEMALQETGLKYAKTKELHFRLATVMAKNDSIAEVYLAAARSKGLFNNKVLSPQDKSKFAVAVRNRKLLGLTTAVVDSMIYHTTILHEQWASDTKFDPKSYERNVLSRLLDDKQYLKLLQSIHQEKAATTAQADWKELTDRALTDGLDSTKVIRDITFYYLTKWIATDRYGSALPAEGSLIKAPQGPMPQGLQLLRTARKYNNPIPEKSAQATFKW